MALTKTQVSMLYTAIFNRASEGEGNKYWQDNQPDMATTANVMLDTSDAKEYFGDTINDNQAFIELIYKNTLNKTYEDDKEGIDYWVNELNNGKTKGDVVTALVNAVLDYKDSQDPATKEAYDQFMNRVEVSNYVADHIEKAPENYKEVLGFDGELKVTADDATVEAAKAEIDSIVGDSADSVKDNVITLTENPDELSGDAFVAPRVWNPDGSDQMNSLNDDDILTGTGENSTLDVTIVNDTESDDLNIMPTLNNIATINTAFTADRSQTIDLQDATGVKNLTATRIDNLSSEPVDTNGDGIVDYWTQPAITYDNIQSSLTTATVKNSNDNVSVNMVFDHSANALSGDADEVALTLSNVQMNCLRIDGVTEGYETINLTSTGSNPNSLNSITDEDIQTLNISGDQNLTIAGENNVAGSLTMVDASALEANLDFRISQGVISAAPDGTSSGDVAFTIKSGTGDDIIRVSEQIGSTDVVEMGDGNDTLVVEAVNSSVNYTARNTTITGVEAVQLLNSYDLDQGIMVSHNATIGFLADEADGDQTFLLRNNTDGAGNNTTYNIMNLSEVEAKQITIEHSGYKGDNPAPASNALADNIVNLDVEDGVSEVAVTIGEGVNTDPGFNFRLSTDSDLSINTVNGQLNAQTSEEVKVNNVTSLTIHDNDSESNTVELQSQYYDSKTDTSLDQGSAYTESITIDGGREGKYLNLDATANIYRLDLSGTVDDSINAAAGQIVDIANGAAERLVANSFDASESKADIVARFSTNIDAENGGQNIKTGSGNDTVIFDNLNDTKAGLSISDTVDAGDGFDTLMIDGDLSGLQEANTIKISDSEWTNVSNFETLRLAGAGTNAKGDDVDYDITLTDAFISRNNDDGLLHIINDNSIYKNREAGDSDNVESNITIHAESLSDSAHFTYNGEERSIVDANGNEQFIIEEQLSVDENGNLVIENGKIFNSETGLLSDETVVSEATNDRIIVSDSNINGKNVIDGGYVRNVDIVVEDNKAISVYEGNGDVLEIRNKAVVTIGDLDNISNIGTLEFTNDQAVTQNSTLELNDTVVDRLVYTQHSSISRSVNQDENPSPERLHINVVDSDAITSTKGATSGLTLDASSLTDRSDLDILLGRGDNNIQTGGGQDHVVLLGNYQQADYNGIVLGSVGGSKGVNISAYYTDEANDEVVHRVVDDNIDLGAGNDILDIYGRLDLSGATLNGIETINVYGTEEDVVLNDEQKGSIKINYLGKDGNLKNSEDATEDTTEEQDNGYTKVALTADTVGVEGVAEEFTYQIDSKTGQVLSLVGSNIELSGFTVGEDKLTFVDVENGTVTTETFTDEVIVSGSAINNTTDIYFDEDNDGNSYQLTVVGVVDETLDSMDMSVVQA